MTLWMSIFLVSGCICQATVIGKARTTASGCTYEYITSHRDYVRNRCYSHLYYNGRREADWTNHSDMSNIPDRCCEKMSKDDYCFGVQFWGECWTDQQCNKYESPPWNKPPRRTINRNGPDKPDKIGGQFTNSYYCAFKCGYKESDPLPSQNRIVGGTEQGVWPWVGALYDTRYPSVYSGQFCDVSLISCRWALTAAHCIYTPGDSTIEDFNTGAVNGQYRILFGETSLAHPPTVGALVKKAYARTDQYTPITFAWDIALIELQEPISLSENIHPICLDDEIPEIGKEHFVIGWGSTNHTGGNYPVFLQGAHSVARDDEQCPGTEWLQCFENRNVTKGMCTGDSGGPIMRQKGGRWYQTGVVSAAHMREHEGYLFCADPGYAQYGTKVGQPDMRAWVHEITGL